MDLDGKRAAAVEPRDEPALVGVHVPLLVRGDAGQRHRAGQQFQRAAFGVVHPGVAGQGEGRHVAAEIAGQLEVFCKVMPARAVRERVQEEGGGKEKREILPRRRNRCSLPRNLVTADMRRLHLKFMNRS